MNNNVVSVIIPSYNHSDFIVETLHSIYNQTYENIELIIIDDGSTDKSVDVIYELIKNKRFKKRFLNIRFEVNENKGLIKSLNEGFKLANGDYVAQIASDDLFMKDHIKKAVEMMSFDENIGLFFSNPYIIYERTLTEKKLIKNTKHICKAIKRNEHLEELLYKNYLPGSTIVYNKRVFKDCGYMDPVLKNSGEINLHWKIASRYKFIFYNKPTGYYRIHKRSTWLALAKDIERLKEDRITLLKRYKETEFCKNEKMVDAAISYTVYDFKKKGIFENKISKLFFLIKNTKFVLHDIRKII